MSIKSTSKSKNYVSAKDLFFAVVESQNAKQVLPNLLGYFEKMCEKIVSMNRYPYEDDYKDCYMTALSYCCSATFEFDTNKSHNAFSFFTQVIKNANIMAWSKLYPKKYKNTIGITGSEESGSGIYSL